MNFFDEYTWEKVLSLYPERKYNIAEYHRLLSPKFPEFLNKYLKLPVLQRLKGIGLLCGTDWTKLYKNRFFYSRYDHSLGVALIIWHFTNSKAQTIAGLLHDVSTPVFSHVSDFRKGDALTQTSTEETNSFLVKNDIELQKLLEVDGLSIEDVQDYHIYPVADNEIPQLSADRLEYMFPSGMALEGSWSMEKIQECYSNIVILKNENNIDELGFKSVKIAEEYCRLFCMTGHILQLNENKLTLQLLGKIMNLAVELNLLSDSDFMKFSESEIIEEIENFIKNESEFINNPKKNCDFISKFHIFCRYYNTFRNMTKIEHTEKSKPESQYFCVNLKVKQRYINPLVINPVSRKAERLSDVSDFARKIIHDFLNYEDTAFGCVKLI